MLECLFVLLLKLDSFRNGCSVERGPHRGLHLQVRVVVAKDIRKELASNFAF